MKQQQQQPDGNNATPTQTVELSQALRERLKERHDSIGLLSRRRCSGISPLARSSTGSRSGGVSSQHSTATVATSPSGLGAAAPVSPTCFPSAATTTVVVTSTSSGAGGVYYGGRGQVSASPSSPRLSPVQGSLPTSPRQLTTTANCGTSPDHSLCPIFSATSIPPSPEGRSTSPFGGQAVETEYGGTTATHSVTKPTLLTSAPSTESTVSIVAPAPVVVELATLGVGRPRRRSRPSVSPERPCPSSPSASGRLPRLRRQSTTLDEGTKFSLFRHWLGRRCCCLKSPWKVHFKQTNQKSSEPARILPICPLFKVPESTARWLCPLLLTRIP